MQVNPRSLANTGTLALIALPILCLAAMSLTWLRLGMDLPTLDDWRGYIAGRDGSFTATYLFGPSNDTIYAVGKILDSAAQRLLGGNAVAYQFLSMTAVLGTILLLQWKLLIHSLGDRLFAAICFSATIFMLQPGSYWGRQSLAYHQALPLVFLLLCLWVILRAAWQPVWKAATVFVFGTLAGLSYTSGAFTSIAMAIVLIVLSAAYRDFRPRAIAGASALLLSGLITSSAQAWVLIWYQGGGVIRPGASLTPPTEPAFWLYLLGKIGRALSLPKSTPHLSLSITLIVVVLICIVLAKIFFDARATVNKTAPNDGLVIFLSIASVLFVYLLMVAAGRSGFQPYSDAAPLRTFSTGFGRFHFFWVTILWPWLIASIIIFLRRRVNKSNLYVTFSGVAIFLIVFDGVSGGLTYDSYFQENAERFRVAAHTCMLETLSQGMSARCDAISDVTDWPRGYAYAVTIGSTFVRSLPPQLLLARNEEIAPWTEIVPGNSGLLQFVNARGNVREDGAVNLVTSKASQIIFSAGAGGKWDLCVVLEAQSDLEPSKRTVVPFFFNTPRDADFSRTRMVKSVLRPGEPASLRFLAYSYAGFGNRFRFDPATHTQHLVIKRLRVRCLLFALR